MSNFTRSCSLKIDPLNVVNTTARAAPATCKADVLKMIANGQSVAYVAQALGVSLITHSDRGGQYVSAELKESIRLWHIKPSMSRATMAEDPYDNVSAESLWSRLKAKLLEGGVFLNVEDARTEIFDYIEVYYNRERRHCAGSPVVAGLQKL